MYKHESTVNSALRFHEILFNVVLCVLFHPLCFVVKEFRCFAFLSSISLTLSSTRQSPILFLRLVSHCTQSSLKKCKLSFFVTFSDKSASKPLTKATSQCGWSAQSLPRRTSDACPCLFSSGKFTPRPKSNAQSSDAEGLGNDGGDENKGPVDDDDDGVDD